MLVEAANACGNVGNKRYAEAQQSFRLLQKVFGEHFCRQHKSTLGGVGGAASSSTPHPGVEEETGDDLSCYFQRRAY